MSNSRHRDKSFCCRRCLQHFSRRAVYERHIPLCGQQDPIAVVMPEEGEVLEFTSQQKQCRQPYFIVADFEAAITHRPTAEKYPETPLRPDQPKRYPWVVFPFENEHALSCKTCTLLNPCNHIRQSTEKLCHMEMFSWGYKVISAKQEKDFPLKLSQEKDCVSTFLSSLKEDMIRLYEALREDFPLTISESQ